LGPVSARLKIALDLLAAGSNWVLACIIKNLHTFECIGWHLFVH